MSNAEQFIHEGRELQKIGILGPCSFEGCNDFASGRCGWKNSFRLSDGGCDELFCPVHGYTPEKAKEPVSCKDCQKAYRGDKKRTKVVLILAIVIVVIIAIVVTLSLTVLSGKSSSEEQLIADATKGTDANFDALEALDPQKD